MVPPFGVTISFPKARFNREFARLYQVGERVDIRLKLGPEWKDVRQALEAGPLLVQNGKIAVDMKVGGWLTLSSKKTQASRLDRADLRGPEIGVGLTQQGELLAIAVNGRTRDSFGVNFFELAKILLDAGAYEAMAFDPGKSATLWIDGKVRNIPPYNADYNRKIYYAAPQPRGIGNAVVLLKD
jgi:hypothetical protein